MVAGVYYNAARGFVDAKQAGVKLDAKKVTDAVTTSGSAVVTSATAAFTSADVGKVVWILNAQGTVYRDKTTIASVDSATQVTLAANAGSSGSSLRMVYGTDDTDAIRAACAEAKAARKNLIFPAGGCVFNKLLFDLRYSTFTPSITIRGAGRDATIFYPSPDFDGTSTGLSQILWDEYAQEYCLEGFTWDGGNYAFSGGVWAPGGPLSVNGQRARVRDVKIKNGKGCNALLFVNGSDIILERVWAEQENNPTGTTDGIRFGQCSAHAIDCYAGNVTSTSVRCVSTPRQGVRWIGGVIDECWGNHSLYLNGACLDIWGTTIFSGDTYSAARVDGTSTLWATQTRFIPFGSDVNRGGLLVNSGGKAYVSQCDFDKTGTGVPINNSGLIVDCGGNRIIGGTVTGAPIGAQSITAAGAIDTDADRVRITGPSSSTYAVTLAAPPASRSRPLTIEMIATTSTNAVTLALTNVDGGSASSSASFDAAGEKLVLAPGETKWTVIRELGVTLS